MNVVHVSALGTRWAVRHVPAQGVSLPCDLLSLTGHFWGRFGRFSHTWWLEFRSDESKYEK